MTSTSTTSPGRLIAGATLVAGVVAASGMLSSAAASAPPPGDYCAAHLALEAAFFGAPGDIAPAIEEAAAAVPEEIADVFGEMIDNAPAEEGLPTPEFIAAYNQVVGWIRGNCGFGIVDVVATEYSFDGLPEHLPAGPTVLTLTNDGSEVHEIVVFRKADDVTDPAIDLLTPDEEFAANASVLNGTIVMPGEAGSLVANLQAGSYFAVCFLPVGNTPQMVTEMMSAPDSSAPAASQATEGTAPTGPPPHFVEGMVQEFTVTDSTSPTTT